MRGAALVCAGLLILGALGVITMSVHGPAGSFIGAGVVLLAGAVAFFWALRQGQGSSGNSGDGTDAVGSFGANLAGSFRLFALKLTGASAGIASAVFALMELSRIQHPTGSPFLPAAIVLLGCGLGILGSVFVVVDAMDFRRTGRRF